ncbi:hypothetical protein Tco_0575680 [Tanacetum coccineum]
MFVVGSRSGQMYGEFFKPCVYLNDIRQLSSAESWKKPTQVIKLLFSKCVRLFAAMEVSLKGISSGLRSLDTSQLCADVGAALAPATTATSGHRKDEILTTQCSLLIYEKLLNKKKQLP